MGFSEPSTTADWVEEQEYPYEVWTDDDDRTLSVTYGAASSSSAFFPDRITVIVDREGTLILEYTEDVNVGTHPAEVLADCALLFGP